MTCIFTAPPRSYIFYIIADVGFPGTHYGHRPLAITYRRGRSLGPTQQWSISAHRAQELIDDCASIITVLTEPTNRVALEAELASAVAWYRSNDRDTEPQRNIIPDALQPQFEWRDPKSPFDSEKPELPWAGGIREFPFISSCVRLALNRPGGTHYPGGLPRRLGDVQEQTLETAFDNNKLEYGMVVIDISGLDNVRYGIIARRIEYLAHLPPGWHDFDGWSGDPEPAGIQQEKPGSCQPLSCTAYMRKCCHLYDGTEASKLLERYQVATLESLDYIWPRSDRSPSILHSKCPSKTSDHPTPNDDESPSTSEDARIEEAVARVIQDAAQCKGEREIFEAHHAILDYPSFQAKLLAQLAKNPDIFDHPACPSSTQLLLRLAHAGKSHLNWVSHTKLSYEDMAAAIAAPELQESATALSICLDKRGDDSPTPLLEVLARSETIRDLAFLQGPERANDEESSRLFSHICASTLASRFLGSKNIYLTGAFSAALRRKTWLPANLRNASGMTSRTAEESLLSAFPVQYMFVRQQFIEHSVAADGDQEGHPQIFRPCHFFLGDALLKPERLVAGFSKYCRSILSDRFLLSFTMGLRTTHNEADSFQRATISPIPAENFAIPETCSVSSSLSSSQTQIDCWPLFRALEPNGWVLLVSHEWHTTPKTRRRREVLRSHGRSGLSYIGVPSVRYAFLRARKRLTWPEEDTSTPRRGPSLGLDTLVDPDSGYVEVVGGAEEFLRKTAPEADRGLAERCLGESVAVLRERWPDGLGEGLDFISTLDEKTARSMMRDFLQDAAHVRGNLKMAMQLRPEELLKDSSSTASPSLSGLNALERRITTTEQTEEPINPRNGAVFKSLHDAGVHGSRPLGTESATEWGPEDYTCSNKFIFDEVFLT